MNDTVNCLLDKKLSPIGLGCVTFGREIGKEASFALMDFARSNGVTFFDTAAAYGNGASETIIGEWLEARAPSTNLPMIATKILPPYTSSGIRQSVNQSLKRLHVSTIDILYLHRWHSDIESLSALETLHHLVKEGKVRMLGASNFNADQLNYVLQEQMQRGLSSFCTIQNNHNLAVSDLNDEIRNICRQYKIAIVTYSPLGAGFLTGKYQKSVQSGTRFSIVPGHQTIYFNEQTFRRLAKLQEVASRTGYSSVYLALAWALHQADVASVLVGGRSLGHLKQAFSAFAFNESKIFSELDSIL